jgi:hypothetical protein
MALNQVTCPNCGKALKTRSDPAPGVRLRCPGCETVFSPDGALQDESSVPASYKARAEKPRDLVRWIVYSFLVLAILAAVGFLIVERYWLREDIDLGPPPPDSTANKPTLPAIKPPLPTLPPGPSAPP